MNELDFIDKVVCPQCLSKIEYKAPFNTGSVCKCRKSKKVIHNQYHSSSGIDMINYHFELALSDKLKIIICIYAEYKLQPYVYVSSTDDDDKYAKKIFEQLGIPDYIFLPLDQLISKIEILSTFS